MSIGPYFSEFNRAYLNSRELGRREGESALREGLVLEDLRRQQQESQDMGMLAGAFQARRRALQAGPPPGLGGAPPMPLPPTMPSPMLAPDQTAGLENAGVPMPAPAPSAITPGPPPPAAAPPTRENLLASMSPDVAGRLLRSPQGRSAIKDLEQAEKEHEGQENRKKAEEIFGEATKAMKAGDAIGYYDHAAKAMRVLGNYQAAAQYTEHGMNLRGDDKENKAANEDLGRWVKANSVYTKDPSPENYATLLDELGQANSKGSRALRGQIIDNVLKKTFNQNPQVTGFSRAIAGAYRDAFADGKEPNAEAVFKNAAAKDPEGFNAYIYDALANHKALPEVVLKNILRWDLPDKKEMPQTAGDFAFIQTQGRFPGLKKDDPRFMEAWWKATIQKSREMAAAKEKPEDTEKGIRADVSEMRKRLSDVRGELRRNPGMADEDPERYKELREEEKQANEDLKHQEGRMRKSTGAPEAKPQEVEIPVRPPAPKLKPGDDKYRAAAKAEMSRLSQAGYTREQAITMMQRAGWK